MMTTGGTAPRHPPREKHLRVASARGNGDLLASLGIHGTDIPLAKPYPIRPRHDGTPLVETDSPAILALNVDFVTHSH